MSSVKDYFDIEDEFDWDAEFYVTERGDSPVIDFIDALPKKDQAQIRKIILWLLEFGIKLEMPHAKAISGHNPIRELRPHPNRLFYVARSGNRFVILHAFTKKSNATPAQDIATAERRFREIQGREGQR